MTRHAHHSPRGGAERETGTRARDRARPVPERSALCPMRAAAVHRSGAGDGSCCSTPPSEPLTAVTIRRAIVLVLRDRADVVHADAAGNSVHSAGMAMPVPP